MNNKICIISGPSSVGKSTFLQSTQVYPITNLPLKYPVVFPRAISNNTVSQHNGFYFHYNTLRVADHMYRNHDHQIDSPNYFLSDPPWNKIREFSVPIKAIVLLASRSVLEKRMLSRRHIESRKLTGHSPCQYPVSHWLEVLARVNLHELYTSWCYELKQIGIPYTLINSESKDYGFIEEDQLEHLRLNT